jgi:hypothetical protein
MVKFQIKSDCQQRGNSTRPSGVYLHLRFLLFVNSSTVLTYEKILIAVPNMFCLYFLELL